MRAECGDAARSRGGGTRPCGFSAEAGQEEKEGTGLDKKPRVLPGWTRYPAEARTLSLEAELGLGGQQPPSGSLRAFRWREAGGAGPAEGGGGPDASRQGAGAQEGWERIGPLNRGLEMAGRRCAEEQG